MYQVTWLGTRNKMVVEKQMWSQLWEICPVTENTGINQIIHKLMQLATVASITKRGTQCYETSIRKSAFYFH